MASKRFTIKFYNNGRALIEENFSEPEIEACIVVGRAEFLAKMDDLYLKYGVTLEEAAHGDD